jgi:uncharacterized membrane protein YwaF
MEFRSKTGKYAWVDRNSRHVEVIPVVHSWPFLAFNERLIQIAIPFTLNMPIIDG